MLLPFRMHCQEGVEFYDENNTQPRRNGVRPRPSFSVTQLKRGLVQCFYRWPACVGVHANALGERFSVKIDPCYEYEI